MIEITIKAIKADVLNEVARTTAYEGKKSSDEGAYERIFTTEEDRSMLQRFWDEAASSITESMKRFVTSVDDNYTTRDADDGTSETLPAYVANLAVSSSYDTALTSSIEEPVQLLCQRHRKQVEQLCEEGRCTTLRGRSQQQHDGYTVEAFLQEEANKNKNNPLKIKSNGKENNNIDALCQRACV